MVTMRLKSTRMVSMTIFSLLVLINNCVLMVIPKQLINDLYLTVIYGKQVGDKTQKFLRNLKSRLVTKFSKCRMRR